jgi:Meiotically up-regulated gene 113
MSEQKPKTMPGVSVSYAGSGQSITSNAMGMRAMQQRVWQFRGEQYLLLKSPPASGKSRALMFVALDKLHRQNLKQAIVVVPEKSIGASFGNTQLAKDGFFTDWTIAPQWNLCNAPGTDGGKVEALGRFLASEDRLLVCTHATFRFAFEKFGVEAFDDRLIAVDEFHHVSVSDDNRLGEFVRQLIERDKTHLIAMTGSYFRGDAAAVLMPEDERRFATVTYTYYEQLSGYKHLKQLDIGYYFYSGSYLDDLPKVLDENEKTIIHIPNVNSRESTQDKHKEVEHILETLGEWLGTDDATGFQLVKTSTGRTLRIADLVDDELLHKIGLTTGDPEKRVSNAKKETTYLFAAVELVAVYRLANINCKAFESLLHKFLARARIDLALADRFGGKVQPREWFLVPLPVVEEVVERIKDGSISKYRYDPDSAALQLVPHVGH